MHDELQNAGLGVPQKRPYVPHVEGNDQGRRDLWECAALDPQACYRVRCQLGGVCVESQNHARDFEPTDPDDGVPDEEKHSARVLVWLALAFVALVAGWAVLG